MALITYLVDRKLIEKNMFDFRYLKCLWLDLNDKVLNRKGKLEVKSIVEPNLYAELYN